MNLMPSQPITFGNTANFLFIALGTQHSLIKNLLPHPQARPIRKLLEPFQPPFPPNPALLCASKRDIRRHVKVRVYPDAARRELAAHPLGSHQVLCPDRRSQAEPEAVCALDHFLVRGPLL